MAIELLIKKGMNMKDLILDEPQIPRHNALFDSRRDIPGKVLENAKKVIAGHAEHNNWGNFARFTKAVIQLFPEQKADLPINEEAWEAMRKHLFEIKQGCLQGSQNWSEFIDQAEPINAIFPERKVELGIDERAWNDIRTLYASRLDKRRVFWDSYLVYAAKLPTLFPNYAEATQLTKAQAESMLTWVNNSRENGAPEMFAAGLADIRLLYPDHYKQVALDHQDWQKMKGRLNYFCTKDMENDINSIYTYSCFLLANNMQILAADEVRITNEGLQIINHQPLIRNRIHDLPLVRKF